MKLLATGASGYIGGRLVGLAQEVGHEIVVLSRGRPKDMSSWLAFDLNTTSQLSLPADIDVVVHLAAETISTDDDSAAREITAARALITAALNVRAKFIFVSSQTAREDAPTNYGRTKWRIEQEVLATGGLVVRIGQVYGGLDRGLFGMLTSLVRRLPVLPAFSPPPLVQPIHLDDCTAGLLKIIESGNLPSRVYCLAAADAISFTDFLQALSRHWVRQPKIFFPTPSFLIRLLVKLVGTDFSVRLGLYRFNSLFDLPLMSTAADLDVIGLQLRTLDSGMHRSGCNRRRMLIREARGLLTYVLRENPSRSLTSRYVRMIEKLRGGGPLPLPSRLFHWPAAFALLDHAPLDPASTPLKRELFWRTYAATVIAEGSTQGAIRFLGNLQNSPPLVALARIFLAVIKEALWRLAVLFASPLLARILSSPI